MNYITLHWHNNYNKFISYSDLAEAIVSVYINVYNETPTIDDLKEFIWGEEYLYDYTDELIDYLFPYDTDSNCANTELSDLEIENKDEFYKYLETAINNVSNSSGDN